MVGDIPVDIVSAYLAKLFFSILRAAQTWEFHIHGHGAIYGAVGHMLELIDLRNPPCGV